MAAMTSKERMLIAMNGGQPDMVPVAPDMSNMIPCRLTGKPFWDIYLYQDPPLWKAYIDAVRYFGFDGWLPHDGPFDYDPSAVDDSRETVIVFQSDERIITREYQKVNGSKEWSEYVTVYYRADPPTWTLASILGMAEPPTDYKPIERVPERRPGIENLKAALDYMGDDGLIGMWVGPPQLARPGIDKYDIYAYVDRPDEIRAWVEASHQWAMERLERILTAPVKPDFILTGGSGMLVFNTPDIVREITLPTIKAITERCKAAGMPTQIHCCGPERELVRMCAEETDLSSINPLEIPPMGDCDLADVKRRWGRNLSLMGNIHTTDVMLKGTPEQVAVASRRAIDDAAEGGGFILSTGDQCGRDTPDENIRTMVEVARTYGRY